MIKIKLYTYFLIGIAAVISCNTEDPVVSENEQEDIDIGSYYLLESSIEKLTYQDRKQVIYVDSIHHQVIFEIVENQIFFPNLPGYLFRYNVNMPGDTVKYLYRSEVKRFTIRNDSLNLHYDFTLTASPYYPDPESENVADIINIFCRLPEQDSTLTASQVLYLVVDPRSYPEHFQTEKYDEIEFISKKFLDVFHSGFNDPVSDVYFNYEHGMVSLTDHTGKRWRFERFVE